MKNKLTKEKFIEMVRSSSTKLELLKKMGKASRNSITYYEKKWGLKVIRTVNLDVEEV